MSRPGFLEGAVLAAALAVAGAVILNALAPLLGTATALRLTVTVLAAVYLVYLLYRSPEKTGRLVVPAVWATCTVAGWTLLGLPLFVVSQVALLWLARALYFHGSPLGALVDLALSGLALAAALWALGTGSWLLALWCFFLVEALLPWVPAPSPDPASGPPAEDDGFDQARALARAALERLASGR